MMKLKNIFILAAVSLMSAMAVAQNVAIIPQPYHIDQQKGTVTLGALWYDYPGDWCKGIEEAPLKGEYVTDGVCIPKEAKENIGLVITRYLEVPEDGVYTFRLYSDDGSQLTVDGVMVVDNDGMHDARELVGQHAMKKGLHLIRVLYFDHNGGDLRLKVEDKHGKEVKVRYWH